MFDFREYLDYADKYIKFAEKEFVKSPNIEWLLIPSIVLSWIAVESFINNMFADFSALPEDLFELHERALLLEKKLKFIDHGKNIGKFVLDQTEYRKLEEKIFFLIAKFSKKKKKKFKGDTLWQEFQKFRTIRNEIMHLGKELNYDLQLMTRRNICKQPKILLNLFLTMSGGSQWISSLLCKFSV